MKERIPCEHMAWVGDANDKEPCPNEADQFFYFHRIGKVAATCSVSNRPHATAWGSSTDTQISREEFIVLYVLSS